MLLSIVWTVVISTLLVVLHSGMSSCPTRVSIISLIELHVSRAVCITSDVWLNISTWAGGLAVSIVILLLLFYAVPTVVLFCSGNIEKTLCDHCRTPVCTATIVDVGISIFILDILIKNH